MNQQQALSIPIPSEESPPQHTILLSPLNSMNANGAIQDSIVIQLIGVQQINQVLSLFQKYLLFYKVEHSISMSREFLTKRLSNGSKMFVAYLQHTTKSGDVESIPAGFSHLYPSFSSIGLEENYILNDLYVEDHIQGHGVGTKLIQHVLAWADKEGAYHVEIGTKLNNYRAQALYPKLGFVEFTRYADSIRYKYKFQRGLDRVYPTYYPESSPVEVGLTVTQQRLKELSLTMASSRDSNNSHSSSRSNFSNFNNNTNGTAKITENVGVNKQEDSSPLPSPAGSTSKRVVAFNIEPNFA